MTTLHIFRGLPASGKTTEAKALVNKLVHKGTNVVRVERDDIRLEVLGAYWTGVREDEEKVTEIQHTRIRESLKMGFDVISSDTNLRDKYVRATLKHAHDANAEVKWYDLRDVPVEICIKRDEVRSRTVGSEVIQNMFDRYIKGRKLGTQPTYVEKSGKEFDFDAVAPYVAPEMGKPTILLDIDGTVANHEGVRSPYDTSKYREDTVHWDVVDIIVALDRAGYKIHVFSGRHVDFHDDLEWWLNKNGIPFHNITMRERAFVSDDLEKLYLFEKYVRNDDSIAVHSVFDDRNRVVFNTWRRALGIRCFHVQDGDF